MGISRSGWVLGGASAVTVGLLAPGADGLVADVTGRSFPDASVATMSLILLGIASWSLLVVTLTVLGASSRVVTAITPVALRRALLAGAAGALVVTPAHAEQLSSPDAQQHTVGGLALPDRPDATGLADGASTRSVTAPATAKDGPSATGPVRVRPGDTLWAIAERSLPAGASDADIADATAAWHRTNRDVIGDDPDVIVPRQLLAPPSGKDHS